MEKSGIVFMNVASNTRGSYMRNELDGITHMSMAVRDAFIYDLEL